MAQAGKKCAAGGGVWCLSKARRAAFHRAAEQARSVRASLAGVAVAACTATNTSAHRPSVTRVKAGSDHRGKNKHSATHVGSVRPRNCRTAPPQQVQKAGEIGTGTATLLEEPTHLSTSAASASATWNTALPVVGSTTSNFCTREQGTAGMPSDQVNRWARAHNAGGGGSTTPQISVG